MSIYAARMTVAPRATSALLTAPDGKERRTVPSHHMAVEGAVSEQVMAVAWNVCNVSDIEWGSCSPGNCH